MRDAMARANAPGVDLDKNKKSISKNSTSEKRIIHLDMAVVVHTVAKVIVRIGNVGSYDDALWDRGTAQLGPRRQSGPSRRAAEKARTQISHPLALYQFSTPWHRSKVHRIQ
ncbi:hypothetical protein FRB90_003760 [Tulasnella sp. 427]|nr:hypothetical protein FRB90_003760 [Tulasnella sp. 427]